MKIGILGGGQLGRMFIQNALSYDDEFHVLDPAVDCSCASISHFTEGNFNDFEAVLQFGEDKDIITIEIEHVNAKALVELEKQGKKIIPSATVIQTIQEKIRQKEFYAKHSIPTPEFQTIQSKDELNFPLPFVQKLNTGGYDGRGVQVIKEEKDLENLWDAPSVIEKLVEIDKELAIIVARNESGETRTFPVTEMVADAKLNLLDFNICPAEISENVKLQIENIAQKFIEAANSPGLFAIELFLDKNGKVWLNETAPRLHNSGHQSQEGNANSQFEQMYRVLKNLPLADTDYLEFSGMLNLVGEENHAGKVVYEGLEEVLKLPKTYVHLYGKTETRPGRKMGHINILADSRNELLQKLVAVKQLVKVKSQDF